MKKTLVGTLSALGLSLRSLRRRWWAALNSVLGTAVVVAVMVAILAIGAGYTEAMKLSEIDDSYMVMKGGARSEMDSVLTGSEARLIVAMLSEDSEAAAGEVYAVTALTDRDGAPINVALRGVSKGSFGLHADWKLVAGRLAAEGRREIVVGRRAQMQFGGLDLGQSLRLGGAEWTVVGVFETGGTITESELWAAATQVQDVFDRPDTYQVVIASPEPGERPADMEARLNKDSRLSVSVVSRRDYYGKQADAMRRFVTVLGFGIGGLMALGAVFAALNTGLSQIKARAKELATLSVLGWTQLSLGIALAVETVLLALAGAAVGVAAVHVAFDNRLFSTLFFAEDFTQVVFDLQITGAILWMAAALAMLIGLLGSIGPALQMRRLPVARILLRRN